MGLKTWLGLKRRTRHPLRPEPPRDPVAHEIVQRWSPKWSEDYEGPIVTFGIKLRSRQTSPDWTTTQQHLAATLRSVFRQTDQRWRVLICGHEKPKIPEVSNAKVEFISAQWAPPGDQWYVDGARKRFLLGMRLRSLGGGYFMQLDADDLLHRDLVGIALSDPNGCVVVEGFMLDAATGRIAPVPGAMSVDIDRICGSTAVVRYDADEIPTSHLYEMARHSPFGRQSNHNEIRVIQEERDKTLRLVPFPATIYVINTGQNISFLGGRRGAPARHILELVRRHEINDRATLRAIDRDFGTALASAQATAAAN